MTKSGAINNKSFFFIMFVLGVIYNFSFYHTKGVGLSAFFLLEGPGITCDNERMKISPHL